MWNIIKNFCTLRTFILSLFLSPVYAQGITFEEGLSWQQIKDKAKTENKYIFIDCFATWCSPCKKMDKEVYSSAKVGTFFNDRFISIKLQMDTTNQDNEQVLNWHPIAAHFTWQYNIKSFPTYLFFSPNGKIINKQVGYYKENDFLTIASNTLNPNKQYYTLLENYKIGKIDYTLMPNLALKAKYFGDEIIANDVALYYINNHLTILNGPALYTKENILFMREFIKSDKKIFNIFYHHRDEIDLVMDEKKYAQNVIDEYMYSESIYPFLRDANIKNKQPNWKKIIKSTKIKYGKFDTDRNILSAKIKWFEYKEDWAAYSKTVVMWVNQYKENLSWSDLNGFAWNIFRYIDDEALLNIALNWSTQSIQLCSADFTPNYIDTKANILYKLGRTHDAIALEQHAIKLAHELKNEHYVNSLTINLTKMKKGEPTWSVSKNTKQ